MNFEKLTDYLENIDKNYVPECEIVVSQNNERVYYHYTKRDDVPYEPEKNKYYIFSASKPITCTAALMLVEQGIISLDDPVSKYLPEYGELYLENGEKAKNTLTVKHLFTMTGGFSYNLGFKGIRDEIENSKTPVTTRQIVSAISKMPLLFEPGEGYQYSLCHDILGGVIEVASGMKLGEFVNKKIFTPLGMKDSSYGLKNGETADMKRQYAVLPTKYYAEERKPQNPFIFSENYESGGAGIVTTLNDYALFADALASGKSKDGYVLLKPETIELMRENHIKDKVLDDFKCKCSKSGYGYGLGVRTLIDKKVANASEKLPLKEFGWDGAAGAYTMFVPEKKLSVYFATHVLYCNYIDGHIHKAIRNLVTEAIDED